MPEALTSAAALGAQNLLAPAILFFVLGFALPINQGQSQLPSADNSSFTGRLVSVR